MPESFVNQARITPAYAGKRIHHDRLNAVIRDHPRLCGEKNFLDNLRHAYVGITPAYAGKSNSVAAVSNREQDHPRLCGEKCLLWRTTSGKRGSPPPMRGKVTLKNVTGKEVGITPAYAGKSGNVGKSWFYRRDHPRLCGEKPASSSLVMFQPGSPPPMRGKEEKENEKRVSSRITPAYAGKSDRQRGQQQLYRDHPRLCGEKTKKRPAVSRGVGSPPPMRGKD